ncbi:MAG: TlpA disulfide reductase family protein [Bacteroidetes bacterium]|nr:TlpA disulfide reductase family protein [Bacteroidota bacterium]
MKKLIFVVIVLFACNHLMAQKSILIKGDLKNVPDSTVVTLLDGMANKEVSTDIVIKGKFTLKGKTPITSFFIIGFSKMTVKLPLFISNDPLKITGDIMLPNNIVYEGSASHAIYMSYMKVLNPKMEGYFKTLTAIQSEKNTKAKDSLTLISEVQSKELILTYVVMSKKYAQSPVTTFFLFQFANIFPTVKEKLGTYFDQLQGAAKTGPFAEILGKTIQSIGIGSIGSFMPEFKQNDVNGNAVSLSSFKGKYVLVDFWASWCGPCRAENPNVVKAYNEFKNKNFTILSVSLDQDKAKWLDAIQKDGLTWTHVSDLKYWNNAVAQQFGIQSIPASFIIDPAGKIIGKDLRGEDLRNFLIQNLK